MKAFIFSIFCFFIVIVTAYNLQARNIKINENIELIQLNDNAYIHVSNFSLPEYGKFPSNGLIYISNKKAFLFDTPMSEEMTKELVGYLQDSMKLEIIGFAPNHWHDDCIAGLEYLKSIGAQTYSNYITADISREHNLPVCDNVFHDSLKINFDNKQIELFYLGAAHSIDNIVVWLPAEKILFAGCMAKEIASKNLGNTKDGDLLSYPIVINKVLKKFSYAKIVIPGHGEYGGLDILTHTLELCKKTIKK